MLRRVRDRTVMLNLDDFDEGTLGTPVGEVTIRVTPVPDPTWVTADDLAQALRALSADARGRPVIFSVAGQPYTVTGVTPDGVLQVDEVPF